MKDLIDSTISSAFGRNVYIEENIAEGYDGHFVRTTLTYSADNGKQMVYELDYTVYEIISDLSLLKGAVKK